MKTKIILTLAMIIILTNNVIVAAPTAVPTFECLGIYWDPPEGAVDNECQVKYRVSGAGQWKDAVSLWYDDRALGGRPAEYRGSILNLEPGTTYEIELTLLNTSTVETFTASTWSENFPIGQTIYLPESSSSTYVIDQAGTPSGYILYTHDVGSSATIDVDNAQDNCIQITGNAAYVIIRGLTLRDARNEIIMFTGDAHDVVIEECDLSNWGDTVQYTWDKIAIHAGYNAVVERIIIQRNKIHHPRGGSNSWDSGHPDGPQGIGFHESLGNHVIRYNELWSDLGHYFNDIIGRGKNFSFVGFPNRDSDIYGNYIANCWDDGIESEGANMNVRIWGNYIEHTFVKIAIAATSLGPLYIYRNVSDESRKSESTDISDDYDRGPFIKAGGETRDSQWYGSGRTYVFHNTVLQPDPPGGQTYPLGCNGGVRPYGGPIYELIGRNNIFTHYTEGTVYSDNTNSCTNDMDYNLYNGTYSDNCASDPHESHGIFVSGFPVFDPSNIEFSQSTGTGEFALNPGSDGIDDGEIIPNFNDGYYGSAPDMGAFDSGEPPMEFGVNAYLDVTQYSLTVNISGSGSVSLNPTGSIYNEGTVVTMTANPDVDWSFDSWSGDLSGSANPETITMNSDKNVTATFINVPPPQYTLTVNAAGSGSVALDPPGGTYDEYTVVTLTATPDAGYQFDNWTGDLTGTTNPETITMNSDKNVTAIFSELPPVTVYDACDANIVTGICDNIHAGYTGAGFADTDNQLGTYVEWTNVTVSETKSYNCTIRFANGSAAARSTDIEINSVVQTSLSFEDTGAWTNWSTKNFSVDLNNGTNNFRVVATGSNGCPNIDKLEVETGPPPPQYTLTVNTVGSGSVTLNPTGGTYDEGTVVTLTATPDAGNQFDNWTGDLTGTVNPETITMDADKTVTANFSPIPQYTLYVNTAGSGSVSLNPPGGTYESGTVVTLTATPDAGNQFDNWTGDLTGTVNPETITMDANKTVTANFSQLPQYTLYVNTAGSGSVSLDPPGGTYDTGTVVTLTAAPNAGYQFDNWSGDLTGTVNPATVTMDANKTVTVNFSAIPQIVVYDGCGANVVTGDPCETKNAGYTGGGYANTDNSVGTYVEWTNVTVSASQSCNCTIRFSNGTGQPRAADIEINGSVQTSLSFESTGQWTNWSTKAFSVTLNNGTNIFRITGTGPQGCPNIDKLEVESGPPPTQYTLTVNTSGNGSVSLDPSGGIYNEGTVVTLTATPDAGNQFDIWTGDLTGTANPATITMDANKTVTANFSVIQYTLTVNTSGNGSVSLNPAGGTYDSGTVVTLTATPDAGNQFDNWTGDLTGTTNPATITMDANKTVTANFNVIQYTLIVNTSGNGSVSLNPPGGTYNTGTVVTLTATPDAGNQFDNWTGDLTGTANPGTITMDANKTVTGNFSVIQYTLTVNTAGSGSVTLNPPGGTYNSGTVVTLTATPDAGNQFDIWTGDLTGTVNPATITMDANKTVTANFSPIPQYTLTVNTAGSGSVSLNPPGGTYDTGTVVTLTATPDAGNQFDNWTGDLTGTVNPATITMDANKTVTANFSAIPQYTLTKNTVGSGSVTLNPTGGTYDTGTVVTLTATPDAGNQFDNWTGDLTGAANPETITMDANKTVTANFSAIPQYTLTVNTSGSGTVSLDPPGGTYDTGTVVTLTATPDAGNQFNNWSGDLTGTVNPETITMDADKNVTAVFSEITGEQAFLQDIGADGIVSMEVEHYDDNVSQGGHDWISNTTAGYSGDSAMEATPNDGTTNNTGYAANSPRMDFKVDFVKTGTHYIWARGIGPTVLDDSYHAGLNGQEISTCDRIASFSTDWTWSNSTMDGPVATFEVTSTGVHTVNVWMREDGFIIDKLVLTVNSGYTPSGTGPAESSRSGGPPTQYTLTVNTSGSGSVTLNPPGDTYDSSTVVTLTASPAVDWMFDSWSGDLSGSINPVTINMDSNKNVTATFTEIPTGITQVGYFDTWDGGIIPSTDGAGIAFYGPSEHLYIADSEINEIPEWNGVNIFEVSTDGSQLFNSYDAVPVSGNREPTGIAYNSFDGYFYITNDDAKTVVRHDADFGSPLTSIQTTDDIASATDPEGITCDPQTGYLYVADGSNGGKQILVYTSDLVFLSNFSVADRVSDPEGIAFHPVTHHLFIVSGPDIYEYTTNGVYINEYNISGFSPTPVATQGGTFGASSDPNDDPGTLSLYIVDGMQDNFADGRVFEASVVTGPAPPQYTLTVNTSGSGSVTLNPPGGIYDSSTVVTLTAAPDAGWSFDIWSGDLTGAANPENIIMDADKTVTATFIEGGVPADTVEVRISVNDDDVEEQNGSTMSFSSSDLELCYDASTPQKVGMRFIPVNIPQGAPITNAYIQFQCDETGSSATDVTVNGEAADNASVFTTTSGDISARTLTSASTAWNNVPAWNTAGEAGPDQRTPDISSVIQEIVNRSGWASGNALVVIISGTGTRTAEAHNGDPAGAPLLHVEFGGGPPPPQYNLTANTAGSGSVSLNPTGGTYDSGTVVTLTATPDGGNQFDNWTGDLTGTVNPATITMDANKTVTASFSAAPQYTLIVNTAGSGSVTLNPGGGTYDAGTVVTLTATPDAGYQFDNWTGDLTGTANPETITMDANKTVTANFIVIPPVAVYDACDANIVTGMCDNIHAGYTGNGFADTQNSAGTYVEWINVEAYETRSHNCTIRFANGSVNARLTDIEINSVVQTSVTFPSTGAWTTWSTESFSVTLNAGMNTFRVTGTSAESCPNIDKLEVEMGAPSPQYTLTVNAANGSVALDPPGGTYYENWIVTLTATPDLDYSFDNWSGALAGTANPETITMDSDKNVTATFIYSPEQRILTVNTTGKGSVSLDPPGGSYDNGTVVTLTATPDASYDFIDWTGDLTGTVNPETITMDTHKTVTANFTGDAVKVALWGDSRENRDNACTDISTYLLDEVTDWDFTVHSGDFTPGGTTSDWDQALGYSRCSEIFNSGKFYMCTSNHDCNSGQESIYSSYTAGVLPTNSADGTTYFYRYSQDNVHVLFCDDYFANPTTMQNWLDGELATINPDDWIIGVWHPPCYGDLTYKSSYLSTCQPWLNSLYANGGDMVLHGHAHVYVRTYPLLPDETVDDVGMVHIVNGCGGASWPSEQPHTIHTAFTPYESSFPCVTWLTFDGNTLNGETVDMRTGNNRAVIDSWTWTRGAAKEVSSEAFSEASDVIIPDDLKLVQNYPNPFNPSTNISYSIPDPGYVRLNVYNMKGRLVATLVDGVQNAGEYTEVWEAVDSNGNQLPSGMYLCRFQYGSHVETIKMMFMR